MTQLVHVDPNAPESSAIARAAAVLEQEGLVAFPTETVYGLGALALNPRAVARIYVAKGRPPTNPIIVHVADTEAAIDLVTVWPDTAAKLAKTFWPGPLTIVLPKRPEVPEIVTAGGETVGIRVPAHPVALRLLQVLGKPIAAPSANRSNQISPTSAEHVMAGLEGRIDMVLDGGLTKVGLESTVVELNGSQVRVLRPGMITAEQISAVLGTAVEQVDLKSDRPLASPGLHEKHYAPRARLECCDDSGLNRVRELRAQNVAVGWMPLAEEVQIPRSVMTDSKVETVPMPRYPAEYAELLYSILHAMDEAGVAHIVLQLPPRGAKWTAIHDRLARASF